MQFHSLSVFNKEKCNHFFEHLTDYFHKHHHSDEESADNYENLLYTVKRPYSPEMLDEIDNWMGLPKRQWREHGRFFKLSAKTKVRAIPRDRRRALAIFSI